jgi:hypothetical protein
MKADAGGLVASKRSADGRKLFSGIHFGMDDSGKGCLNCRHDDAPSTGAAKMGSGAFYPTSI